MYTFTNSASKLYVPCNTTTKLCHFLANVQSLLLSGLLAAVLSFARLVLVACRRLGPLLTQRRLGVPRLQIVSNIVDK